LYRIFNLVHNLVHTMSNICGRDRVKCLPLYLRPDVSITLRHGYCRACGPPENLSHDGNRCALL
jgi:hypothetical protein